VAGAAAVVLTAIGLLVANLLLPEWAATVVVGLIVTATVGGLAVWAMRRDAGRLRAAEHWHRRLRGELISQSTFLDGLVESVGAISGSLDPSRVLERAADQAQRLLAVDAAVVLVTDADGQGMRPAAARGVALGPMAGLALKLDTPGSLIAEAARSRTAAAGRPASDTADPIVHHLRPACLLAAPLVVMGDLHAMLVLARLEADQTFAPDELARAAVFADFVAQAAENAMLFERVEALLAQTRIRETERAELSRRVVTAEQDERRKLSLYLHDGPLQTLSGVGMMLDAAFEDVSAGENEPALGVLETARERQRGVIRSLRELCFALEPWVLRDQGFVTAVHALADEFERGHTVSIVLDVEAAAALEPDDQVSLYQIVREAVTNAVKHARPRRIEVTVTGSPQQGFRVVVQDDGAGFTRGPDDGLPHHGMASMRERAAMLSAELRVESVPGAGTTVKVSVPGRTVDVA
jgi:two-component system sensor histidine kinase UhpB